MGSTFCCTTAKSGGNRWREEGEEEGRRGRGGREREDGEEVGGGEGERRERGSLWG